MEILDKRRPIRQGISRLRSIEMLLTVIAVAAAAIMVWTIVSMATSVPVMIVSGIILTICIAFIIRLIMDPDSGLARQTDSMLRLSGEIIDIMRDGNGMTQAAAQKICELLLPNTAAISVSITDRENILGYAGYEEEENPSGSPIRTLSTYDSIADGRARVLYSPDEIGFPKESSFIQAAIIIPIVVGREVRGTLKFYYRSSKKITETQKSIAQGFGTLLATEIAATEMETQRELATSMELKMLQSQINPHFLFNTINTIALLIRTDPTKARVLLREFATFYRSTLEDSQDRIKLSREFEQAERYFSFEVARFGEDRLAMVSVLPEEIRAEEIMVPPFLLQPLVENAVRHAMPAQGKMTVTLRAHADGSDLLIDVEDDGMGMSEETRQNIMHPESQTGLGIAVKNVHDRLQGFFGPNAQMLVESQPGLGTTITLRLPGACL